MKLGTQIRMADGREATVVYNSLIGVGVIWGLHNPDPADFEGTNGDTVNNPVPKDWKWEPEALLRNPGNDGQGICEFTAEQCVGEDYTIIREGLG